MTRPPVGSTGTLAELQVEPGDVVECVDCGDASWEEIYTIYDTYPQGFASHRDVSSSNPEFRLISRANPDQPQQRKLEWRYQLSCDDVFKAVQVALDDAAGDGQPAHIITHEGRDYDLTALETPFGLLPDPVQDALRAWPHGWAHYCGSQGWQSLPHYTRIRAPRVYRAVPAPTENRVQCYRGEYGKPKEHGTCIKRDGEVLWDTWEPDA